MGFVNFLKKAGLVEDAGDSDVMDIGLNIDADITTEPNCEVDVPPDIETSNDVIGQIYEANSMGDTSVSVYKVKELMGSLPKEMPEKTVKQIIKSLLVTLGINVDYIIEDANNRKAILMSAFNNVVADHNEQRTNLSKIIEDAKETIQESQRNIESMNDFDANFNRIVNDEMSNIAYLVSIVGDEVNGNDVK